LRYKATDPGLRREMYLNWIEIDEELRGVGGSG
jgi:hypothetical protein